MKKMKKFAALLLAVSMAAGMVACGSSDKKEETTKKEETKKDDPAAAQKAKFKQWYQNLVDCTSEYTLKSLAEEYFATEGFYTYLGSLPDEEQEALDMAMKSNSEE